MEKPKNFILSCPFPIKEYSTIRLAHGGGGKLTHELIEKMFMAGFGNTLLSAKHDSSVFSVPASKLAVTTDSFVVKPLFFPGGDIGSLSVYGTVNDLAMSGARPLYLTAGFILEEGLSVETLWKVVQSMQTACQKANVKIIAGDTKVVDKGKGDGIFINTSGVGIIEHDLTIAPSEVKEGDAVIVSGDIGRHGIAIMAMREGLEFETTIESDCAPLYAPVEKLLSEGVEIHCLRDLTRGGLASALNEIAEVSGLSIHIDELSVPVRADVQGACEMLGFDPLYVANEGRFVAFVAAKDAQKALQILQNDDALSGAPAGASLIGEVTKKSSAYVTMKSKIGSVRIVDMLSGEQLPRIC